MTNRTPKKPVAIDIYEAEQITAATHYTAHFMIGRGKKQTIDCPTIEEARDAAQALNEKFGGFGRRAIIYAVSPSGASFPVS